MKNTLIKTLGAAALYCVSSLASATSVSLVPTTAVGGLSIGDAVSFDIVIDFGDDAPVGGGIDILFDDTHLMFTGAFIDTFPPEDPVVDPFFARLPDYVPGSGLLEGMGFGNFNGLKNVALGSVSFEVISMAVSVVALSGTESIAGDWVSGTTFVPYDPQPDYNSITVESLAPIPLPAAAWLFGSALLGLAGLAKRRA